MKRETAEELVILIRDDSTGWHEAVNIVHADRKRSAQRVFERILELGGVELLNRHSRMLQQIAKEIEANQLGPQSN